jgi:hypothetical protein
MGSKYEALLRILQLEIYVLVGRYRHKLGEVARLYA